MGPSARGSIARSAPTRRPELGAGHFRTRTVTGAELGVAPVAPPIADEELARAAEAARRALPKLPGEMRGAVAALLEPESLAIMGAVLAVWAGSHFIGVGVVADVLLVGAGVILLGVEAVRALEELTAFWRLASRASTEAELDRASEHFARGVTILGVNGLAALVAKRGAPKARKTTVAVRSDWLLSRWARYIDSLQLRVPADRGALWSKLGDKGELAESLARRDGRVTLEMLLKETEFFDLYGAEFGATQNAVTARIWELVSRRFAQGLSGRVVAYVDNPQLLKSIQGGNLPQITAELDEISEIMRMNPKITSVVIRDIMNGASATMTREQVLRASRVTQ